MAHTYSSVTTPDTSYTPVSDVRPVGDKEDQLTWAAINPNWDTWNEFLNYGKVRWSDWWYGDAYIDNYTSLTTPSYSYSEVTK